MRQAIAHVTLVVRDYDEAIAFFCRTLHFRLVEDTYQPEQDKRWVVVAPPGTRGTSLLLARASTEAQIAAIGSQTGGRVSLFLETDDFWRDYREMRARGVEFVREPTEPPYGTVAVFRDLYGNLWDLVQPKGGKHLVRASLVAGAGTAAVALASFGLIHAWWITPIWDRLLGGVPFVLAGGLALGWAYAEFSLAGRLPRSAPLAGLAFGVGAWMVLLPATALNTTLRLAGLHGWWSTVGELAVTAGAGMLVGARVGRRWRPVVACGLAAAVLLAVQAGPIPIANGARPVGLFFLVAVLYAMCGAVQAVLTDWLQRFPRR